MGYLNEPVHITMIRITFLYFSRLPFIVAFASWDISFHHRKNCPFAHLSLLFNSSYIKKYWRWTFAQTVTASQLKCILHLKTRYYFWLIRKSSHLHTDADCTKKGMNSSEYSWAVWTSSFAEIPLSYFYFVFSRF